jgi:type II secretory pathway component GspD/PulD (secretin)
MAMRHAIIVLALAIATAQPCDAHAQARDSAVSLRHDSVSVHLVDADIRAAVEALAPYLDKPVGFGSAVPGARVTLETPAPVARTAVRGLLEGLLESQNLELVRDSAMYRVQAKALAAAPSAAVTNAAAPGGSGTVQLYVIRLKHARAPDVAATVNALFGRASALGEPGSARPATLDQQLQSTMIAPVAPNGISPQANAPTHTSGAVGRGASFTGDVTIVPDARSNSLFIRASQSDYDLIVNAVQQLDTRPLQVLIEVIIAEIERTNSLAFGVDATLPPTKVNGGPMVINGSQTGAGLTDVILHAMNLTGLNIDATLTAAAERGDVRILSRPVPWRRTTSQRRSTSVASGRSCSWRARSRRTTRR